MTAESVPTGPCSGSSEWHIMNHPVQVYFKRAFEGTAVKRKNHSMFGAFYLCDKLIFRF